MRKPIIAGNWKMNKTNSEAKEFIRELKPLLPGDDKVEVVVCPPFTALAAVKEECKGSEIKLGAQNLHWEESGAFTGEISTAMLIDIGVEYVIIGHSERRSLFGETDENVNKKAKKALQTGLKPIICVGETLQQRENNETFTVCDGQVKEALQDISAADAEKIVIAYEPVWAIGTGKTASAEDAQEVIKHIRATVAGLLGEDAANKIRIQYGGSVKPGNIASLMEQEDIDGALVGGASLKAESFSQIIKY